MPIAMDRRDSARHSAAAMTLAQLPPSRFKPQTLAMRGILEDPPRIAPLPSWLRGSLGLQGLVMLAAGIALGRYAGSTMPDTGQPVLDWHGAAAWIYLAFVASVLWVGARSAVKVARHR
ncbi:MAG: hypothetical protein AB7G13_07620 [Lautropia sp.]